MPDPFDWERDRIEHWHGRGDGSFVTHYELEAIMIPVSEKLYILHTQIEDIEGRLLEVRAKNFAIDIASSAWSKFIIVVLAVLTAFILTDVVHVSNPFG